MSQGVAFSLFGMQVHWYGIFIAISVVFALLLIFFEGRKKGLTVDDVIDCALYTIPCAIVGGRLYYVIFSFSQYKDNLLKILYVWEGGLAIYGVILGGIAGVFWYCKRKRKRFLLLMDLIAPGVVLGQAIGRWGNFFNQEAFGYPVTNPALQWFPFSVKIDVPHLSNGIVCDFPYHMATFFYESLWCFGIFLFLLLYRKKPRVVGKSFFAYVFLYGVERTFVEGLRADSLWLIPNVIRVSQLLSIILIITASVFFIRCWRKKALPEDITSLDIAPESAQNEQELDRQEKVEEDNNDE